MKYKAKTAIVAIAAMITLLPTRVNSLQIFSGSSGNYDLSNASSNIAAARQAVLNTNFDGSATQILNVDRSNQTALATALSTADV